MAPRAVYIITVYFLSCILVSKQEMSETRVKVQSTVSESSKRFREEFLEDWHQPSGGPQFDLSTPTNVIGLVGRPVKLLCRIRNLQNRTVSWVRHRDIHLLTVGRYTYTSDQRFEAQHQPRSEDWILRIRSSQKRDTGQYECQISTTPPKGYAIQLNVVEPKTEILGGPDIFVYTGSTVNLTCLVQFTPEPPDTIVWTHNGKALNFDTSRGGILLLTEKGIQSISTLLLRSAKISDAGLYTCSPDNAPEAAARTHVLTGETPAAMHGHARGVGPLRDFSLLAVLAVILRTDLFKF